MAVRVGATTATTRNVKVVGNNTQVKKVVVGTPVRRLSQDPNVSIANASDVDITGITDGTVLVYNASRAKWVATLDLEDQNINGGSY